jgi:hypothetical protein
MRWRRETCVLLIVLALIVGSMWLLADRGAAGLGIVACDRDSPFGPCGDSLVTLALQFLVMLLGGVTLLAIAVILAARSPEAAPLPAMRPTRGPDRPVVPDLWVAPRRHLRATEVGATLGSFGRAPRRPCCAR